MLYKGTIFKNRNFDFEKLKQFGFVLKNNDYIYKTSLLDGCFELIIKISNDEIIDTKITEIATCEQYNLVYISGIEGEFVGKIKTEFENILLKIKNTCTYQNAFKSKYSLQVINYIKNKYNVQAEYLWEKFPNTAIFRKKEKSKNSGKWFAVIMTVSKNKIGLKSNSEIEIIDLKAEPEIIQKIIDNKKYFQGYHMNKKHWLTVCLDGSICVDEIKKLIDESYNLV